MELGTGIPRSTVAMRSGMSENTTRRYRISEAIVRHAEFSGNSAVERCRH